MTIAVLCDAHMGETDAVVVAAGLTKEFGTVRAVDGLDLEVRRGSLCGFLGRNGAGKTTTIRMLLGLVAPTRGDVRVLGHDVRTERDQFVDRVGAIVETPSFHPWLSGRTNLRVLAWASGLNKSDAELDKILARCGLDKR